MVAPVGVYEPSPIVLPFWKWHRHSASAALSCSALQLLMKWTGFGKLHHAVRRYVPEWAVLKPSYFMQNLTISMALRFGRK
ncbi:hypothetical protein PO124_14875 [Bacillus licheniformis]|nr:hypothetical protein [Bacillus licheniformis]